VRTVRVFPSEEALARHAAERIAAWAQEAAARGRFTAVLSGGRTPLAVYGLLAADPLRGRILWPSVHLFWADERCVPPDHPDSNFRAAREPLLDRVPIPAENVHRMEGERGPGDAADRYERGLRTFFEPGEPPQPRFDVVLLGCGEDGHTASLFPGSHAVRESSKWVLPVRADDARGRRITLTPAAINAGRRIVFLATGSRKAGIVKHVLEGPRDPDRFPAQTVRPVSGDLHWWVDAEAAALLMFSY